MTQSTVQATQELILSDDAALETRAHSLPINRMPRPGEPAPWFRAPTLANPNFSFDTVGGRSVVLCFLNNLPEAEARRMLEQVKRAMPQLNLAGTLFFGVSADPRLTHLSLFQNMQLDDHLLFDTEGEIGRLYGLAPVVGGSEASLGATTFVLDERLRVLEVVALRDGKAHFDRVMRVLGGLDPLVPESVTGIPAPVLVVPRIFEPALCEALIDYYKRHGGERSGFMRDIDGRTVLMHDDRHKKRCDRVIEDLRLREACMHRIHDRLVPEIQKAFQFRATRIERYIVACYSADDAGHFRRHRDNTTQATAHRRFAVSLNLNTDQYSGGQLRFPEFGSALYQPPVGGAIVFSCSLLHEAKPVTEGNRYVFLPFLYDDEAALHRVNI